MKFRFFGKKKINPNIVPLERLKYLIVEVDQDGWQLKSKAELLIELFNERYGGSAEVITFYDGLVSQIDPSISSRITKWTDCFSTQTFNSIWERAYAHIPVALNRLPFFSKRMLTPFFHDLGTTLKILFSYSEITKHLDGPTLIFSSGDRIRCLDGRFYRIKVSEMNPKELFGLWVVPPKGKDFRRGIFRKALVRNYRFFKRKAKGKSTLAALSFGIPYFIYLNSRTSFHFLFYVKRRFLFYFSDGNPFRDLELRIPKRSLGGSNKIEKVIYNNAQVAIVVEDSGTYVNLNPAKKIAYELLNSGIEPLVFTSSKCVIDEMEKMGIGVLNFRNIGKLNRFGEGVLAYRRALADLRQVEGEFQTTDVDRILYDWFVRRLKHFTYSYFQLSRPLEVQFKRLGVQSLLVINEESPLAMTAVGLAQKLGIKNFGFWPILIGDRPDNRFFPADEHLVYGHHAEELMLKAGVQRERIKCVGSPTYEPDLTRNKEKDRRLIKDRFFNNWSSQKLVIVLTEALPRPWEEILPTLSAIEKIEDCLVILKVHPSDSEEYFKSLVGESKFPKHRIRVIKSFDLYALLNAADLITCAVSNVIITAASFEVPTLVCDFNKKAQFLDFVEEGLCFGCHEVANLENEIRAMLFDHRRNQLALGKLKAGMSRFNGPNDGRSHVRVAELLA